jgi:predicted RNase H-like HicB family nuclease
MPKIKIQNAREETEELPVEFFKEGDMFIATSPVLDLSTCGETFEEAKKNFVEALDIFMDECRKRGTLAEALRACGWTEQRVARRRRFSPPLYVGEERIPVNVPEFA